MGWNSIHDGADGDKLRELYTDLVGTLEAEANDTNGLHDHLDALRNQDYHDLTDEQIFEHMIASVFSSGFSWSKYLAFAPRLHEVFGDYEHAAQYNEDDIQRFLNDSSLIRHEGKIRGMTANAATFSAVVDDYGSFAAYLDTFDEPAPAITEVKSKFKFLGPETTREFLKEIGYASVIKRDVHVKRIVHRIGLIEDEEDIKGIDKVLEEMSDVTDESLSLIDRVIWLHGAGLDEIGFAPVCAKAPNCSRCQVSNCETRQTPYQG